MRRDPPDRIQARTEAVAILPGWRPSFPAEWAGGLAAVTVSSNGLPFQFDRRGFLR
jgi:hypothetical protein